MPKPYLNRIIAISSMLDSPNEYVVQQAIDLLLNLLRDNPENEDLHNEILQTVIEHSKLRPEILRHFDKAASEHAQINKIIQEINKIPLHEQNSNVFINTQSSKESEASKGFFLWWHYVLFLSILGLAILLIIVLPYIYEKLLIVIAAMGVSITLPYLLPKRSRIIQTDLSGIRLSYSSPSYVSAGDQNTINVSVENSGQIDFSGKITLIFNDPDSFVIPAPDQSLSTKISVPPQGREAKQFMFLVLKKPTSRNLNYYFQISQTDGLQYITSDDSFLFTPMSYLRTTWAWLFSSAGLGAVIIVLLWDQLKKLLGF